MENTMTLQEYLNQKDPVRKPLVVVREDEIKKGLHLKITGFTSIWIRGIFNEYLLHENSGVVYTSDGEGNPKNVTVFRVIKNISVSR